MIKSLLNKSTEIQLIAKELSMKFEAEERISDIKIMPNAYKRRLDKIIDLCYYIKKKTNIR